MGTKITSFAELTTVDSTSDYLVVVDTSDTTMAATGTNKKIKPQNLGSATANLGSYSGQIETVANKSYYLDVSAVRPYIINSFARDVKTSGSCTAAIQIDGNNVTGLSGLSCTTTKSESTATATNTVGAGQEVSLLISGNSAALDLAFAVKFTYTFPTLAWSASSGALPSGMTLTRATTALALTGASYSAASYTSHATNVARFERLPSEGVGLLLEGASTAINIRSSAISDAAWATKTNVTVGENATAGPFGGTTADSITETAISGEHFFARDVTITLGPRVVFEALVKPGLRTRFRLYQSALGGPAGDMSAFFDMSTPSGSVSNVTVSGAASGAVGVIVALPGGWYKCTLSGIPSSSGTDLYSRGALIDTGTNSTYLGNAASPAVWIQNVTVAVGSVPLSPIETTTAAVTRNADVTAMTVSPPAGGFAVAFHARTAAAKSGDQYLCSIDDNSANNVVAIRRNSSGAIVLDVTSNGVPAASVTGALVADSTEFKVSASIALNSMNVCVNSTAAARDTSCAMPVGLSQMRFGHDRANANHWNGHPLSGPSGSGWLDPTNDAGLQALNA